MGLYEDFLPKHARRYAHLAETIRTAAQAYQADVRQGRFPEPPAAKATRYVEVIGGQQAVREKAQKFADAGDLRFAAELLGHAVFAAPTDTAAKNALADVYQRLGYGAENGTWRNFYLTGALELREGDKPPAIGDLGAGMASALTVEQLFDTIAIRIDGPRAAVQSLVIECHFTDSGSTLRLTLSNGALIQTENPRTTATADLTLTLTKAQLLGLLGGHGLAGIEHTGDPAVLGRLLGLLDTPNVAFSIVTP